MYSSVSKSSIIDLSLKNWLNDKSKAIILIQLFYKAIFSGRNDLSLMHLLLMSISTIKSYVYYLTSVSLHFESLVKCLDDNLHRSFLVWVAYVLVVGYELKLLALRIEAPFACTHLIVEWRMAFHFLIINDNINDTHN